MRIFKDVNGKDWAIVVNYTTAQRVKAETQLDLFDLKVFEKIGEDPVQLIDVIAAVCSEQIKREGLSKQQLVDALVGDPLESAADALTQEIIEFFPKRRRETLRKIVAAASQIQDAAINKINNALESGDLLKQFEVNLNPPSGDAQASAASTPENSPSAS